MVESELEVDARVPYVGCPLMSVHYDYELRVAVLGVRDGHCVDMVSAVGFVTDRWPEAVCVRTVAGDLPDTWYRREGDRWCAYLP